MELRCIRSALPHGRAQCNAEQAIWSQFLLDAADEYFEPVPMPASAWTIATGLIDRVAPVALRTLDALHVAVSQRVAWRHLRHCRPRRNAALHSSSVSIRSVSHSTDNKNLSRKKHLPS